MSTRPPVIVLGVDSPIGLTVVRELGSAGAAVHGIARSRRGLGLWSRHLYRGYVRAEGQDSLVPQLVEIARTSGASLLMTISMGDALAVRAAADEGRLPGLRPLVPPLAKLELVNDKASVCEIAQGLGIPVPQSWQPQSAGEPIPPGLSFPLVLKWRDPESAAPALGRLGIELLKSEYARDEAELRSALARYRTAGIYPVVQSYCPGTGLGQMFLMKDGRAVMRFQHRRLHEWPPEGGVSTLCESLPADSNPELMAKSEALLREIGWEGPAMVEYRHDPVSGATALMEINGRFWGSLPLASAAGAKFGLGTYLALGLGEEPPAGRYRAGVRCRYMVPETRRLLRVVFGRSRIADRSLRFSTVRELLRYAGGFFGARYYVFRLTDAMPFLADLFFIAREAVFGSVARFSAAGRARRRRERGARPRPAAS